MVDLTSSENPIITLPDDEELKTRLRHKLLEYEGRYDPHRLPELQMDTICKREVLTRLFDEGKVRPHDLSVELYKKYGSNYSLAHFINACEVIQDYIATGGANNQGGTGFPTV